MATWVKAKKCDLIALAAESGVEILASDTAKIIIKKIREAEDFEEEFANNQIVQIEQDRLEVTQLKREEREIQLQREERESQLQRKAEERAFELEKLKLTQNCDTISISSSQAEREPRIILKNVLQKFDPEKSDIALYLNLFQRQAVRANIPKEDWITNLLGFLPASIAEIILREPSDQAENFEYMKEKLLERFKLSPEDFRLKFVTTNRPDNKSWKDFQYEIANFLDEWLAGVKVTDFEQLRDLMITDQLKRKVSPEVKEHFLDSWGTLIKSKELAEKLDAYEAVRRSVRKQPFVKNFTSNRKFPDNPRPKEWPKQEIKRSETKLNWREKNDSKREEIFEKRKERSCFNCNSTAHLKYDCPKLQKKSEKRERVNHIANEGNLDESFIPYISKGLINGIEMDILRDTGATCDVISANHVSINSLTGEKVWVRQALDNEYKCLPVASIILQMPACRSIQTTAAVVDKKVDIPHYILGNKTQSLIDSVIRNPECVGAVITRQQSMRERRENTPNSPEKQESETSHSEMIDCPQSVEELEATSLNSEERNWLPESDNTEKQLSLAKISRENLIAEQTKDTSLVNIREKAKVNKSKFHFKNGLLVRETQDHHGVVRDQIVIPMIFRKRLLALCHEGIAAHLGATKTKDKIMRLYFWPNIVKEIESYVKSCDPCQKIGKPKDKCKAPLKLVPIISEIFTKLCVDCVGPLPPSEKGNKYMLTALCLSSKYPDAVPIPDLRSVTVIDALTQVFSRVGFPQVVQTDLGSCFVSNLTSEFFEKFGIKIVHSSVCHPESNPVERWHKSVKRLLKVLCLESGKCWERNLPYALLALRTVTHESTGFSPSELVHGKNIRTPETILHENWMDNSDENYVVTEYVFDLINRMKRCQDLATHKMRQTRAERKKWYDRTAVERTFKPGDKVLVLALARPNKLAVNWTGPGTIIKQISDTNYTVKIPGRREAAQIYHVNLLKPYHQRDESVNIIGSNMLETIEIDEELDIPLINYSSDECNLANMLKNSELENRCSKVQINELESVLNKYTDIFSNNPGKTDLIDHDIQLTSDTPVRMRPYRTSPRQANILRSEINKMLELGIIEEGESNYTSPMILVESPGKDPRPCIDYRKLNAITKPEIFPLPNIEERVEKVASAKYITVLDLTKGYWQIPLTPRAQKLAAFVTNWGSYLPKVMPFGLLNASYRFSKFMSILLRGLEDFCLPYLDDTAIFSNTWEEHIEHIDIVLERIKNAKIKIKPSKCKFAQRTVQYLGHVVGNGQRTPVETKIQTIINFPTPKTKTEIRRFLGMAGYYSRYIKNYAAIIEPLTNALKGKIKKEKIHQDENLEKAVLMLKQKLTQKPVLFAPDYNNEFIIQTDASGTGLGVIMAQRLNGEEHPILYLSRKFTPVERKFSASERECAAIIFAVQKLKHYIDGQQFSIETDHDPLKFLKNNSGNNARLLRWSLILQQYSYTIKHRPGRQIPHVDCLSRIE